jgi:UDP-3-O-[3-hydroxymyristoyl] glucosamine N-acyltransferase
MSHRLGELAARLGLQLKGDPQRSVTALATLDGAGPTELSFFANPRYRPQLRQTAAAAVILRPADAADCPVDCIYSEQPQLAFARLAELFERVEPVLPGIHPSAVIDASARVDASASIGPFVQIGPRSIVDARVQIGAGSVIGPDCRIGADSRLVARVTLVTRVSLGARVLIHPGAVIGADGFGLVPDQTGWRKVPQLGGVVIGDDCEIGANTTIDRGALGDTVLEQDVRLDNQIQIGHNVHIGAHTAMAGCSAAAGSARIGRHCLIGGGAGVLGHLELCDRVTITAMSLVTHSIKQPGEYSSGVPLMENRRWRRAAVRFKQLDRGRVDSPPRDEQND